jgi:hypothetical protein
MRYLKGTLDYGLTCVTDQDFELHGYSESYWSNRIPDHKSTSTYFFSLGSSMVSWSSRKKLCVTLSMDETKYVATCAKSLEAMWLQKLMNIGMNLTCRYNLQEEDDENFSGGNVMKSVG